MRFSILALVTMAMCCVVHAGWLSWSGGGDGGLTSIPHETGNVSSYALDGWSPKPTAAPDAVQPESDRVLGILKRDTTTSNWTNAETCGWIADSQSSSFGCGNNGTCVTNANHIVACATGTYSPFYSMCLNYDAYTSGSCKNEDSSTGCCMNTEYPECVTYLWVDPPQRSMYRCWKSSVIITMLDEPEIVQDHPTHSATSSSVALIDSTSTEPNQQSGSTSDMSVGKQVGISLGVIVAVFIIGLLLVLKYKKRNGRRVAKDHRNVREHLDSLFRPGGTVDQHRHHHHTTTTNTSGQGGGGAAIRRAQTVLVPRTSHLRASAAEQQHGGGGDRTRRAYSQLIVDAAGAPRTPDQSRIHSRNRHGQIHLDHLNPTSSTAAMYDGSEASPGPPSYDMHLAHMDRSRLRAPGGTYGGAGPSNAAAAGGGGGETARRPETPPPTYQPGFLSASTLGMGNIIASRGTLRTGLAQGESQPNWIELSRSSPTLPAATRRATMWHPNCGGGGGGGGGGIPASSTWQDVSGSVLTDEEEEGEGEDDDESVFGTVHRPGQKK